MQNSAEDIGRYIFQPTDALLLDANVWYFIYGPSGPGDKRVAIYSGALARIRAAKSQVYMDVLVLSEFINRYARFRHALLQSDPNVPGDFKRFRKSTAFKPIAQDIAADVRQVLRTCARIESGFSALDINVLVAEYEQGDADFNDQVLVELCKSKGLKLVTDDADFKDRGLTVITANKHLLT